MRFLPSGAIAATLRNSLMFCVVAFVMKVKNVSCVSAGTCMLSSEVFVGWLMVVTAIVTVVSLRLATFGCFGCFELFFPISELTA